MMINKEILKKSAIIVGSVVLSIYALFLIVPFFLSGIANSCGNYVSSVVKESTGFVVKFENIKFVTTPKLTVGAKIGNLKVNLPNGENIFVGENLSAKASLLPLLVKKVELDAIGADNIVATLNVKKDGHFEIEDFLPQSEQNEEQPAAEAPMTGLPMGLKLSDRLPNISVKNYKVSLVDMPTKDEYYIQGEKFNISDFIINKKVKVSTSGKVVFADRTPLNYNVKIFNKIMPDVELNDLVFAPQQDDEKNKPQDLDINIIDIFKTVNKNMLTADVKANLKTYGTFDDVNVDGFFDVEKLSLASHGVPLPDGSVYFKHKGKTIKINSTLYTAKDEMTTVFGNIKTGKSPKIDLTCKSKASINNIFGIIDSLAQSVNYKDLETLSATGAIDANFNIKADLKNIKSDGYFKIPSATVKYGLYNVFIDKIGADIDFANDMINIKNFGFTILNQPLKAYGTVKQDTTSDLHLTADKLPIKGLLTAAGQIGLLKENDIHSGTLSMDASIKGKLEKAEPVVDVSVDNVNILNRPSNTAVKLANSKVNLSTATDGKKYKGVVNVNSVQVINPMAKVSVPRAKVTLNEKDVLIDDTYLKLDNSRIDISGKISDYVSKDIAMDIVAKGSLFANDLRTMIPKEYRAYTSGAGKIPVYVHITGNDKAQHIKAQVLATPSNYLNILKVAELNGRNTLISSDINIAKDSLKLSDTGLYTTGANGLPATAAAKLVQVSGTVDKLSSSQILNGLNISTPNAVSFEIPGFKNSKTTAKMDVTLNGSAINPSYKGSVDVPSVSIPTIKTTLKNMTIDLSPKNITVNTPTISVDNSMMKAKTVLSTNFSNGVIVKNMEFFAGFLDTDRLLKAMTGLPAQTSTSSTGGGGSSANLGVIVQQGKGTISRFKSGGIAATTINSDFNVKNNTLYLKGLSGNAFDGKFNGDVSVNLINGKTAVDFHGFGMNAQDAIAGAAGLKNALSGTLGFNAKVNLNGFAPNEAAMMKSLSGSANFSIKDGTLGNIGRLENLLYAQNIVANGIMAAALTPIVNMPVVKSTANFKSIAGNMTFNNGWANLKSVKTSGPSMSTYIYGKYNLLNASANVIILGRLGADVVKVLGPVGELSVNKLTSYIPKFGAMTGKIINAMTTNPNGEKISEIPALSGGNTNYKDFKVNFNGGVESRSSVKSFKWLSVCDTSAIEGGTFKDQLKQSQNTIKQLQQQQRADIKKSVENVKDTAKQTTEDVKKQIQHTKDSFNEVKNLFKKPTTQTTPATSGTTTTTATPATTTAE